jgi:pimeloyl-ACP methyl ester carboxylesterase
MKPRILTLTTAMALFAALAVLLLLGFSASAQAVRGVTTYNGTFSDGATYLIEVPQNWNGTLLLYSHGYPFPDDPNPVTDDGDDPLFRFYLLTHGYALAGSRYSSSGWAVHEALPDQIAVLDTFNSLGGQPSRTIAWGHSLGGLISAGLVQNYPGRFSGALPLCGVMAGSVGFWNEFLDSAFAFKTLLAPNSGLQLVHITDPTCAMGSCTNVTVAQQVIEEAQATPQGQARIALAAALIDSPGWTSDPFGDPLAPEPSPTDYATQEANQFANLRDNDFQFFFALRGELESRAGGNPSWNTGVDYKKQLELSVKYAEVQALYKLAGLSLNADLQALNHASRIPADQTAVTYLSQNIVFNGQIQIPVLTLHTTGDDLAPVQNEQAYAAVVGSALESSLLRQTFVHRAGHCQFTEAEKIAALQALIQRLDTGTWQGIDPQDLNTAAMRLGAVYNVLFPGAPVSPPAFIDYVPAPFLRPFDAFSQEPGTN